VHAQGGGVHHQGRLAQGLQQGLRFARPVEGLQLGRPGAAIGHEGPDTPRLLVTGPAGIGRDLASLSPKLLNSAPDPIEHAAWRKRHEATRWQPDVVRAWIDQYPYQFKFVVSRPADLDELESMLAALRRDIPRHKVLLMPEATSLERMRSHAAWLGEICKARGYRYAHRLHLELYGNRRGT